MALGGSKNTMSEKCLTRRDFLSAIAASSLALKLGESAYGAPPRPTPLRNSLFTGSPFTDEARRLTDANMKLFWDGSSHLFRAPVLSAEAVASDATHDRGYTLWASLLGFHALIEGEKLYPGHYNAQIATVYDGLQQFYNEELHAYTAWVRFPGNIDAYYDDNSWMVIILVEAYLACRKSDAKRADRYLERAKTVMADFVVKGHDTSGKPGGMRWGYDTTKPDTSDRGTSSTAGSALAALMLARAGVNAKFYTRWGHELLTWLMDNLQDKDGFVMDALIAPDWKPRRVKWTYNTGVPMRAYVEHYRLTRDVKSLEIATDLANRTTGRFGPLFDGKVDDEAKRFYRDGTYFAHYLIDGLLQVSQVTANIVDKSRFAAMARLNMQYTLDYLRDPADRFYWRNMRLYTIDETRLRIFEQWTGQSIAPEYDATERSQEPKYAALPVGERPLVKTLLANAGVARMFWLASQLPPAPAPDRL
jgi:hypothetical protein